MQTEDSSLEKSLLEEPEELRTNKSLMKASAETALAYFLDFLPNLITLVFVSNQNNEKLTSAFGIGLLWCNSFGESISYGFSSALETMASHAFGAKKHKAAGLLLQQTLAFLLTLQIPIIGMMLLSKPILNIWMGESPEIVDQVYVYVLICAPGLFLSSIGFTAMGYLNAQNQYSIQYILNGVIISIDVMNCFLMIEYGKMGIKGAAFVYLIRKVIQVIFYCSAFWFKKKLRASLIKPTKEAFKGWGNYLKYAFPIASSITLEWISFEFYSLMGTDLSVSQIAASAILSNFTTAYYQFPEGISIATSTYVGNEMGAGDSVKAKQFAGLGIKMLICLQILTLLPVIFLQKYLFKLFTQEEDVLDALSSAIYCYSIFLCFDGWQTLVSGIMLGIGQERFVQKSFFACYMGLGLLCAYLLTYVADLELSGIFLGLTIGVVTYLGLQVYKLYKTNWNDQLNIVLEKFSEDGDSQSGKSSLALGNENQDQLINEINIQNDDY